MKDISDYIDVLQEASKVVHTHRMEHEGAVPQGIFEAIFPLVGQYESFGAIVYVRNEGFAFVRRDDHMGLNWEGKYQFPCIAVRPNESDSELLDRLASTECGFTKEYWNEIKPLITVLPGRTVQWEEERKARCRTRRCLIEVNSLDQFSGTWKIVTKEELRTYVHEYTYEKTTEYELIDHMVGACFWYLDIDRQKNPNADVDLRKYLPDMYDPYSFN